MNKLTQIIREGEENLTPAWLLSMSGDTKSIYPLRSQAKQTLITLLEEIMASGDTVGTYEKKYGGGEFTEGYNQAIDDILTPLREALSELKDK